MAIFKYKKAKVMDPKEGNNFATTYYQQTTDEAYKTKKFIEQVAMEIYDACEKDADLAEFVQTPLKRFAKSNNQPNYSVEDIIVDLLGQVTKGKDIPSGMLGRWNRIFKETRFDITLELEEIEKERRQQRLKDLFEIKD